jgi:large subunit ribosomal protein L38e
MPKEIKEITEFLITARRKDASSVKIKKAPGMTKFKVSLVLHFFQLLVVRGVECRAARGHLSRPQSSIHISFAGETVSERCTAGLDGGVR